MPEVLTLTAAEVKPQVTNATYEIAFIGLYAKPASRAAVVVHLQGANGELKEVRTDTAAEALTLLTALNTANLTIKSLQKRCLEWCAGKLAALAGAVSGTPE